MADTREAFEASAIVADSAAMAGYRRMHHHEVDLTDFDRPPRAVPPAHRIAICSTPRSGSYLLCRQMINAGLGIPHEYFRSATLARLPARYGVDPSDVDAYVTALEARRTTDNGVFASKLQWLQLSDRPALRERVLARADVIVFLYRQDVVAQAVSWQVSLATGFWSFDATPGPHGPGVSLERTDQTLSLLEELVAQNRVWERILAELGRPVLRVPYEAYARDQGAVLRHLAADLSLPPGAWTLPPAEGRASRLPAPIEAARERLLASARAACAAIPRP
jgi:LPS sulfotransferase NodH